MGRDSPGDLGRKSQETRLRVLLDTNVVIRHLTGDPPAMAKRATKFLASSSELVLADIVVAECVYVLESFYEVPRDQAAELMRAALAMPGVVADADLLLRALEVYELERLGFADAYLVACAELTEISAIASFDKGIDRVPSVERVAP